MLKNLSKNKKKPVLLQYTKKGIVSVHKRHLISFAYIHIIVLRNVLFN